MSESNRISQLLSKMRQESIQNAIKIARVISTPCSSECLDTSGNILDSIPLQSDIIAYNMKKMLIIQGTTVPAESSRIGNIVSATLNNSTNPFDPLTRFAQYAPRLLPPVCPVVPLIDRNANLPKASNSCPIFPNKFYFPTLR